MRAIHITTLDKARPALVLTRALVRPHLNWVTIAPITSRIRGLGIEVPVGPANGLDRDCVINCENIRTIPTANLGRHVGFLLPHQEEALTAAIMAAFELA